MRIRVLIQAETVMNQNWDPYSSRGLLPPCETQQTFIGKLSEYLLVVSCLLTHVDILTTTSPCADSYWLFMEAAILMTSFLLQILIGCSWKWPYWWNHPSSCPWPLVLGSRAELQPSTPDASAKWIESLRNTLKSWILVKIMAGPDAQYVVLHWNPGF